MLISSFLLWENFVKVTPVRTSGTCQGLVKILFELFERMFGDGTRVAATAAWCFAKFPHNFFAKKKGRDNPSTYYPIITSTNFCRVLLRTEFLLHCCKNRQTYCGNQCMLKWMHSSLRIPPFGVKFMCFATRG
jgi:hypothetical protein